MQVSIVQFPGSNRDRDMIAAIRKVGGVEPNLVWHTDTELPASDLVILPGGFSHGDYLRSGAIAARAPIMDAVSKAAHAGTRVLGVCNGFQILVEAGLLPGALMRNSALTFVCREVQLEAVNTDNPFTERYSKGEVIRCPVAHHDGNYFADADTLARIEGEGQVAFRYASGTNPNGSINDIAGIFNDAGNVLGMMPHPENLIEAAHSGSDGRRLFEGAMNLLQADAA
ncbi:phosphoribosylformylglycinamidine synthase subunit PurQ [Ahrensia sp. R2A130]|uniref:phosphoribosylformylglycinamidine synthase subunit PurQ n=1 Tax=Ahrensia sp. R2A130 TaxID=744979 RepID=UPI0001E0B467|nr:phosphoribosylformylglycinamidine synthase subunit PurQ [Ahrensia sp. R2A130]EFL90148.1 phosphoribosylformylglycinamidine synthase I [Ahrensia sp. R2A130]